MQLKSLELSDTEVGSNGLRHLSVLFKMPAQMLVLLAIDFFSLVNPYRWTSSDCATARLFSVCLV